MRLKHFLDIRFTLCSTFSWSSPGFHTNSSYELCLLALSLCLQWHASAFPLLRYRVCVRERDREHVALKSFLSYSPLREKSSNRERERESKLSLPQLDFSQTWVLEWISSDNLDVTAQLWSLCTGGIFKVIWLSVCMWGVCVTGACLELCQVLHGKVLGDQDITTDSWVERGYRDSAAAPGVEAEPQTIGVNILF